MTPCRLASRLHIAYQRRLTIRNAATGRVGRRITYNHVTSTLRHYANQASNNDSNAAVLETSPFVTTNDSSLVSPERTDRQLGDYNAELPLYETRAPVRSVVSRHDNKIPSITTLAEVHQLLGLKSGSSPALDGDGNSAQTWLIGLDHAVRPIRSKGLDETRANTTGHDIGFSVFGLHAFRAEMMEHDLLWWFYRFLTVNYQVLDGNTHFNNDSFLHGTSQLTTAQDYRMIQSRIWQDPANVVHAHEFGILVESRPRRIVLVGQKVNDHMNALIEAGLADLAMKHKIVATLDPLEILRNASQSGRLDWFANNAGIVCPEPQNSGNQAAYNLLMLITMASMEFAQNGSVARALSTAPDYEPPQLAISRPYYFRLGVDADRRGLVKRQATIIAQLRHEIASKKSLGSELLVGKQASINERDNRIAQQAQLIAQKETEHARLMSLLAQKDMTIAEYQQTVARQADFIASRQVMQPTNNPSSKANSGSDRRSGAHRRTAETSHRSFDSQKVDEIGNLQRPSTLRVTDSTSNTRQSLRSPLPIAYSTGTSTGSIGKSNLSLADEELRERYIRFTSKDLNLMLQEINQVLADIKALEEKVESSKNGRKVGANEGQPQYLPMAVEAAKTKDANQMGQALATLRKHAKKLETFCGTKVLQFVKEFLESEQPDVDHDLELSMSTDYAVYGANGEQIPASARENPIYVLCTHLPLREKRIEKVSKKADTHPEQLKVLKTHFERRKRILKLLCCSPAERQKCYELGSYKHLFSDEPNPYDAAPDNEGVHHNVGEESIRNS